MHAIQLPVKANTIALELDKISILSNGGIYTLDDNETLDKKTDFPKSGTRNYLVGKTKTFVLFGRNLYVSNIGEYNFKLSDVINKNTAIGAVPGFVNNEDRVAIADSELTIVSSDGNTTLRNSLNHKLFSNGNRFGVLTGDYLYVVNQWGAATAYREDKTLPNPSDTVLQINLITGDTRDITGNLPCLNRLGNKYGAAGDLVLHDNHLVVSTEEGIFMWNGDGWDEILDNWGLSKLFVLQNGDLLAITSSAGFEVFNLLRNSRWIEAARIEYVPGLTIRNAVLMGNSIYVARGDNKLIVIDVTNIKEPTYDKPKSVDTYNLLNTNYACVSGDDVYVAAHNSIIRLSDGKAHAIGSFASEVQAIAVSHDNVFASDGNQIVSVLKNIPAYKIASNKLILKYVSNALFVLADNHVLVLDDALSLVAAGRCDGDYVEDLIYNPHNQTIYVVGFNNRKFKNTPVQSAFLHKYKIDGVEINKVDGRVWDFNPSLLGGNLSDARALRVELLDANHVVVAGEQAGGNGVFRFNGQDLESKTYLVDDIYSDPGTGKTRSAHILWYGVINTETNLVEYGRYAIPRSPSNQFLSSSNRVKTLQCKDGNIFIGSLAGYKIRRRNEIFNGKPVNKYHDGDASFICDDLQSRDWFTTGHGEVLFYNGQTGVVADENKATVVKW